MPIKDNKEMSFRSKLKIYQKFLNGEKVKEISYQFGCTPWRVKNIIW